MTNKVRKNRIYKQQKHLQLVGLQLIHNHKRSDIRFRISVLIGLRIRVSTGSLPKCRPIVDSFFCRHQPLPRIS